jgi:hypothetical protein
MNQLDLPEMIELLKKDENANLRIELAKLIVSTIKNDHFLKEEIVNLVEVRRRR